MWRYEAGQQFNKMTLVKQVGATPCGAWLCRCDCGTKKIVSSYDVRRGRVQSCGCKTGRPRITRKMQRKLFKLIGDGTRGSVARAARTLGVDCQVATRAWRKNKVRLGLIKPERSRYRANNNPLYMRWLRMKSAATVGHKAVGHIRKWRTFAGFNEDMGPSFAPGCALRQKDETKPFGKRNCYWFYCGKRSLTVEQAGIAKAMRLAGHRLTEVVDHLFPDASQGRKLRLLNVVCHVTTGQGYKDVKAVQL